MQHRVHLRTEYFYRKTRDLFIFNPFECNEIILRSGKEAAMKQLAIVIHIENAPVLTEPAAFSEEDVDFETEPEKALRCTSAFAASELKKYLCMILTGYEIVYRNTVPDTCEFIELSAEDAADESHAYRFIPYVSPAGVRISAKGRAGILYGSYHFLKNQGFRWYEPGPTGEIIPEKRDALRYPEKEASFSPDFKGLRGFWLTGELKESEEVWLWMARNRLSGAGYRPNSYKIQKKLCLELRNGGHIFETLLAPDRRMPDGKTIWEGHRSWYGKRSDGGLTKENCRSTQFCISNPDLLDYLAGEIICLLASEYRHCDQFCIWEFDTWGSRCRCGPCREIGNNSDQLIFFMSELRKRIDRASEEGILTHRIRLVGCAYEGTATIEPISKPVPRNLLDAGDMIEFAPIKRCYVHDMKTDPGEDCCFNANYDRCLTGWVENAPGMTIFPEEYYNVSKFEDLPLLFTKRMAKDIPHYHAIGCSGLSYMHLPMTNWAFRALNHYLYAELTWDTGADAGSLIKDYFKRKYGIYAEPAEKVYTLLEEGWEISSQLRSWDSSSILSQLIAWDGRKPAAPLAVDSHFGDIRGLLLRLDRSAGMLYTAFNLLCGIRRELDGPSGKDSKDKAADLQKISCYIDEDRRNLLYGLRTMLLMRAAVRYHAALYDGDKPGADAFWDEIEKVSDDMRLSYMPMLYKDDLKDYSSKTLIGLDCQDMLTRSQLAQPIRIWRSRRA